MQSAKVSAKVTVSLPRELLRAADRAGDARHYSRSELFREALRLYLLPTYEPTAKEVRAIEEGRAEVDRGEFVQWSDFKTELG